MAGVDRLRGVGRAIAQAGRTGSTRFVTGITTSAPDAARVSVDIGDQIVLATVPGSMRGDLAEGQDVRLSVQGRLYTVDSVLSTLATPAVPAASGTLGTVLGFAAAGYSNAGFTDQHRELAKYSEDYLRVKIGALSALVDGLTATVAELRQALIDQGRAS